MSEYVKFCPCCNETRKNAITLFGSESDAIEFYKGYLILYKVDSSTNRCPCCNTEVIDSVLTEDEFFTIENLTTNRKLLDEMVKLKNEDIIEFELKMSQFRNQVQQQKAVEQPQQNNNLPHCPTCGSTNIKKITATERATSIMGLGIFSKKINKTYKCLNCKCTW